MTLTAPASDLAELRKRLRNILDGLRSGVYDVTIGDHELALLLYALDAKDEALRNLLMIVDQAGQGTLPWALDAKRLLTDARQDVKPTGGGK